MTYPEKWVYECQARERRAARAITVWAAVSVAVFVALGYWASWQVFVWLVKP